MLRKSLTLGALCMTPIASAQGVRTQVVIVVPGDALAGIGSAEIGEALAAQVEDERPATPGSSPAVPRGGVTAIGVVVYGEGWSRVALEPLAVREETVERIAAALRDPSGERREGRGLEDAITVASESIEGSGLGGYRHVLVLLDESALEHGEAIRAARDAALGMVDQVNALGFVRGRSALSRRWLMEHVCASRTTLPGPGWDRSLAIAAVAYAPEPTPPASSGSGLPAFPEGTAERVCVFQVASGGAAVPDRSYWLHHLAESKVEVATTVPDEDHIAFAGLHSDALGGPLFQPNPGPFGWPAVQERILMRVTVCPGDYDRDGVVDQTDWDLFHLVGFPGHELYANWNFDDNIFDPQPDVEKFDAEHANGCASP